jgi:hypothetical protein
LAKKPPANPTPSRRVLTLIPARDGQPLYRDAQGNFWRVYIFIEKARTFDAVESTQQAFQAARRSDNSRNCWPICPRRACTTRFPIFITRQNGSPRWKKRLKPMPPTARNWRNRKLNSPAPQSRHQHPAGRKPAGARHAQRHEVQQRDAR